MEVIVGFAEGVAVIVTCAWPDFVVSATLVAEMVTVFGVGTAVGAVYNPAVLIMPTTEVPPDVPLTAHVTAVLYAPVPVTVAANCWVPPLCTDEEGGFTATAVMVGVGGGAVVVSVVTLLLNLRHIRRVDSGWLRTWKKVPANEP